MLQRGNREQSSPRPGSFSIASLPSTYIGNGGHALAPRSAQPRSNTGSTPFRRQPSPWLCERVPTRSARGCHRPLPSFPKESRPQAAATAPLGTGRPQPTAAQPGPARGAAPEAAPVRQVPPSATSGEFPEARRAEPRLLPLRFPPAPATGDAAEGEQCRLSWRPATTSRARVGRS